MSQLNVEEYTNLLPRFTGREVDADSICAATWEAVRGIRSPDW
jgi:hypothetical protein